MKNWCIGAALVCAGSAWAQSSVTLSGLVDVYAGSMRLAGAEKSVRVLDPGGMSTSFWQLAGIEDLGGGLKLGFKLGAFFRPDTGNAGRFNGDTYFGRDSNLSLSGGLGTVTVGRSSAPNFLPSVVFNPFGDSFTFSPLILHSATSSAPGFPYATNPSDTGWSNKIVYSTPTWAGLRANVHYQFGEQTGAGQGGKNNHGVDVWYAQGALGLVAMYERAEIANPAGTALLTGGDARKKWMLGASYDLEVAKLFLTYGEAKRRNTDEDFTTVQVGVSAPIGAGRLMASVARTEREAPGVGDTRRTTGTVGYDYFLSKRTDVYANLMHDRATSASSGNSLGVGIRHRF